MATAVDHIRALNSTDRTQLAQAISVYAHQEGRRIYDNLRKFILHIFTHASMISVRAR